MKRYIVQRHYESHAGRYKTGQVLELEDEMAAWLNRDSPGVIVEIKPPEPTPEPEARAVVQPPQDRMVKATTTRKGRK